MRKSITIISVLLLVLSCTMESFAQTSPIPGAKFVWIDTVYTGGSTSGGYRGENRGFQDCIFYEPETGNLVVAWYDFYSGDANPRRVAAAISPDGGDTWTVFREINLGLPNSASINGFYPTAWGTSTTPVILYPNRANSDANIQYQPTVAFDLSGWGMGGWLNFYVDEKSDPDTICYYDYYDLVIAPDDPLIWITAGWHQSSNAPPGEFLAVWRSTDGGYSWSRPRSVISAVAADSLEPNYWYNIMSSGLLLDIGMGSKVYAAGEVQRFSGDYYWTVYSTSDDGGDTWSVPAMIPELAGLTNNVNNTDRNKSSIVDLAGNWHLFQVVVDTTDTEETRFVVDCIYDGTSWDMVEIARPQMFPDGLTWSNQQDWLHDPAVDPEGIIYYVYMDVPEDTAAGVVYKTYVKFSENNGQTWKGPVEILDGWFTEGYGQGWSGMAYHASENLHICLSAYDNDPASETFGYNILKYLALPTTEIKQMVSVNPTPSKNLPKTYALYQNFPNPFNPTTTIRFDLKERAHVILKIFNELGQEVTTLLDKTLDAGFRGISWNASGLPSGVYFCQLKAGNYSETKKMVLAR